MSKAKVISVLNHKGGVGKTTTTINLGGALRQKGYKVLLIDLDGQANLTESLGFSAELPQTIYGAMKGEYDLPIYEHKDGLSVVPSCLDLSAVETELINEAGRELILAHLIKGQKEKFDYILIDCMPSLGMMTINALVSSDSVLIPVQAAYLPVKGLQQLIKTILTVKKRLNRKLAIEGILLTMVDFRTNYARDIASRVHTTYGSQIEVFENVIPMSVKAAETSAEGKSIYMHCPKGKVAEAYKNLTQEVLKNEK